MKKLPRTAYILQPGEQFIPLMHGQTPREFTVKAVLSGILLGLVFGAANTYLGLKAGLTISTSIPVAVLSVVVFRMIAATGRPYTILETNLSQTIGSASSSVASGSIFTLPALFLWGLQPELRQLTALAICGGVLGVLFMIPLRRLLIRDEHGSLPYPEGMACAEVLVAAESGGSQAAGVFAGMGVGLVGEFLVNGLRIIPRHLQCELPFLRKGVIACAASPALIGVGFILGIRVASVMVAGAALSWLVLIPLIDWWGSTRLEPVFPETHQTIAQMSPDALWKTYIRHIGAGAVATGGILTLIRTLPNMWQSLRSLRRRSGSEGINLDRPAQVPSGSVTDRTDRDLSATSILLCLGLVLACLIFVPGVLGFLDSLAVRAVAATLAMTFACFFVTVGSRIVGLVGQTSNPISGMTIACLLGTSLIFLLCGWTDIYGKATALMVGTVVCIAASISGDTSQDLKTGYVLGATPRWQQIGELLGVLSSAAVICAVLTLLVGSFQLGSEDLPAPQAMLMKLVIEGVLDRNLPWGLIGLGAGIAVMISLCRLPVLAFSVGVYLPLETMCAIFVGGILRWYVTRNCDADESDRRRERGTLFGSGLVGGGGLMGVALAFWVTAQGGRKIEGLASWVQTWPLFMQQAAAAIAIAGMALALGSWSHRQARCSE